MNKKIKKDSKFIPVFEPTITIPDKLSVIKALNKKNISGSSPLISKFEANLSEKFNSKKTVSVSNGSVALDLAYQLADLNSEDEVIIPAFTIISCLAAVVRSGAKPVFCDVDQNTWNMTVENVKKVFHNLKPSPAAILIGPEGGFSEKEKTLLDNFPFVKNVSLGKQILRAETAMVSAVSIWQSYFGSWARD